MRLTEVIAVWDELHTKDTGELGFCDLDEAITKVVGVENDIVGAIKVQPAAKGDYLPSPFVPPGFMLPVRLPGDGDTLEVSCGKKHAKAHVFKRESSLAHSQLHVVECCQRAYLIEWKVL